jgi:hypothetical protein
VVRLPVFGWPILNYLTEFGLRRFGFFHEPPSTFVGFTLLERNASAEYVDMEPGVHEDLRALLYPVEYQGPECLVTVI